MECLQTFLMFHFQVIKPSLEHCAEHLEYEIEDGHIRALFGNIDELLNVHKSLLSDVEKEINANGSNGIVLSPEESSLKPCHSCLGKVFESAVSFLLRF